ncbi:MAG: hypothetical protein M1823_004643 [Watsoniomyces obsoletus]|nr:MAG: hypothetical protein M1823_004643 [Watsoniomyces obsoletus]
MSGPGTSQDEVYQSITAPHPYTDLTPPASTARPLTAQHLRVSGPTAMASMGEVEVARSLWSRDGDLFGPLGVPYEPSSVHELAGFQPAWPPTGPGHGPVPAASSASYNDPLGLTGADPWQMSKATDSFEPESYEANHQQAAPRYLPQEEHVLDLPFPVAPMDANTLPLQGVFDSGPPSLSYYASSAPLALDMLAMDDSPVASERSLSTSEYAASASATPVAVPLTFPPYPEAGRRRRRARLMSEPRRSTPPHLDMPRSAEGPGRRGLHRWPTSSVVPSSARPPSSGAPAYAPQQQQLYQELAARHLSFRPAPVPHQARVTVPAGYPSPHPQPHPCLSPGFGNASRPHTSYPPLSLPLVDMRSPLEPPPTPLLSYGLHTPRPSVGGMQAHLGLHAFDPTGAPDLFASLRQEALDPPAADMHPSDPDLVPHEQDLRFHGDLYTPRWVRGRGNRREGWCGLCQPGRWLVMKNSAFWYDKSFSHGISATTGGPFQGPQATRRMNGNPDVWEGFCGGCQEWVALVSNKKKGTTWFRHAYKCHASARPPESSKRRRDGSRTRTPVDSTVKRTHMGSSTSEPITDALTASVSSSSHPHLPLTTKG